MNTEYIRDYCLQKENVTEEFPFDNETLVFKKNGKKIFLLMNLERLPLSINLKCNPEKAIQLRETYDFVQPGYHMNKKHWNTILVAQIPHVKLLQEWIDDSFNLVK